MPDEAAPAELFPSPPAGSMPALSEHFASGANQDKGLAAPPQPKANAPGAEALTDSEFYVRNGKKLTKQEIEDALEGQMRRDHFTKRMMAFAKTDQEREAELKPWRTLQEKHPGEHRRMMALLQGMPDPGNGNGNGHEPEAELPPELKPFADRLSAIESQTAEHAEAERDRRIEATKEAWNKEFDGLKSRFKFLPWDKLEERIEAELLADETHKGPGDAFKRGFSELYERALRQEAVELYLEDQKKAGSAASKVEPGSGKTASSAPIDPAKLPEKEQMEWAAARLRAAINRE